MTIFGREMILTLRLAGSWLFGLMFFALFATVCAIALGGQSAAMAPIAPALLWLAMILSVLLAAGPAWQASMPNGFAEQLYLSGKSFAVFAVTKAMTMWLSIILPLIALSYPLAAMFGLKSEAALGMTLSLFIGSPAILAYAMVAGAATLRLAQGGVVIILISLPLLVPTLIFGLSLAQSFGATGFGKDGLALLGISCLSVAAAIPAIAAILQVIMEDG